MSLNVPYSVRVQQSAVARSHVEEMTSSEEQVLDVRGEFLHCRWVPRAADWRQLFSSKLGRLRNDDNVAGSDAVRVSPWSGGRYTETRWRPTKRRKSSRRRTVPGLLLVSVAQIILLFSPGGATVHFQLVHGSLSSHESSSYAASRSVHPFLQGSRWRPMTRRKSTTRKTGQHPAVSTRWE